MSRKTGKPNHRWTYRPIPNVHTYMGIWWTVRIASHLPSPSQSSGSSDSDSLLSVAAIWQRCRTETSPTWFLVWHWVTAPPPPPPPPLPPPSPPVDKRAIFGEKGGWRTGLSCPRATRARGASRMLICRSRSSVGRALDCVWWQYTSPVSKVRGSRHDGRPMFIEHPGGYGCGWWQAVASRS